MVDEEELEFHEEYMNEQDPSILHFLLASGDDVSSKQLHDDLMTMLIDGHEISAALLTWTFFFFFSQVDSIPGDRIPTKTQVCNSSDQRIFPLAVLEAFIQNPLC